MIGIAQGANGQRDIVAAARRLFTAQGYDRTTVEQIARAAGVSRATVFRHFGAKDDILFARYQGELEQVREAVRARRGSDRDRARTVLLELAGRLEADAPAFLAEVQLIAQSDQLRARAVLTLYAWAESLARELAANRAGGAALQTRVLAHAGTTAFLEAVCAWSHNEAQESLVKVTGRALRVALPPAPKR